MRDRTALLVGLVAGAVVGGAAGWLFLTDGGRRLRQDLRPQLDDLAQRAMQLRDTATRVQRAANDSWRTIQEVAARPSPR
jgi:gas vesicle protein